ncbi:MAG: biotin carboxylase N-terminal domain-containing protein [Endozoicomonas sp. (ex Botrylloides leachii)]|nr:biotin carboxylase N-terminal domain-containing protein [Endozoicomonas sp. (ex Botrylloides leachii)]
MSWASDNNIHRLLVANRGEIACRIIKTAKKLGLETIAVYSDADADALHCIEADHTIHIGSSSPAESYLNSHRILAAAQQLNADMIHPGYGFLSENADFAQCCQRSNIIFIGPPVKAIAEMGSKSRAKTIMSQAGVPIIAGYHGQNQSTSHLLKEAKQIGFPLLIKAASGGGGKGMRVINDVAEFNNVIESARREAMSSFGDPILLLESYLPSARHVEVQIFFDRQGKGVYLFDRDCSLQRRHQKIIEEAPAPGLSDSIRKAMGEAAVTAGSAIGYEGAGTVEFLLANDRFYFMEVNTRLQVEHPVTERITGIDLVQWQIKTACGEPLPLAQNELICQGHAIEARIYAEDPSQNFLPSSGRLIHLEWPQHDDIRIDAGVQQGDFFSSWYDPMMAKIIAWGENRQASIQTLIQTLETTYLTGFKNNRDYLLLLINHSDFQQEKLSTSFISQHINKHASTLSRLQKKYLLSIAALYQYHMYGANIDIASSTGSMPSIHYFYLDESEYCIQVDNNNGFYQLLLADEHYAMKVSWKEEKQGLSGLLHDQKTTQRFRILPLPRQQLAVFLPDCSATLSLPGAQATINKTADQLLTAPMNGIITTVNVKKGTTVQTGNILLTMEAMKMEYAIKAPHDGVIGLVERQPGDQVGLGDILIAYQETTDAAG